MRLLKTAIHPDVNLAQDKLFKRRATRAIVLKGESILMLYTQRYHDYSLPGGGLDEGEDMIAGFCRELAEETGAQNIRNIQPFGLYEEYRPWHKPEFDSVNMLSYCFSCEIDDELAATQLEDYEIKNGMRPVWMNIYQAIEHNEQTIKNSSKKGLSIERETFLLKLIVQELIAEKVE
ncbi:NUDIX domain-containing protein [Catenovulum sp. 2E275]|uniref:NUDIX hydrolase n=1 Tax=Catenovulum sp. 2E275 TaxID=2980497 RepID=UPI0021CE4528|nr:NUDIX hydrolase [Catenovulum sp. 2E275]MCU4676039.1 NUDIX domain-containing protein [Catenovulum sp. 2E275]